MNRIQYPKYTMNQTPKTDVVVVDTPNDMSNICGTCDMCHAYLKCGQEYLEIDDSIYHKSKLNLQYCDGVCLNKAKQEYSIVNRFQFIATHSSESIMNDTSIGQFMEFMKLYPWAVGKSPYEMIAHIDSHGPNLIDCDDQFIKDCFTKL